MQVDEIHHPHGRGHMTTATNVMRGMLLRQSLYAYLKHIFSKLSDSIANFGRWEWFHDVYGTSEAGRLAAALPNDSDEDPDTPSEGICPSSEEPSRVASKAKLIKCAPWWPQASMVGVAQLGKHRATPLIWISRNQ